MTGGGGYGYPHTREPERVADDVRAGKVTVAAAKRDYGVAISAKSLKMNARATAKLRIRNPAG